MFGSGANTGLMHIVVVDPTNGKVIENQVFDTDESSSDLLLDQFITNDIP